MRLKNLTIASMLHKDENPRLILVEVGEYWLDSARFNIDVDEFDFALAKARTSSNATVRAEWYERAVAFYRGEYLQNMYYEWVFAERRRLAQSYLNALQELTMYYLSNQSPKQAEWLVSKKPFRWICSTKISIVWQCVRMRDR